MINSKELALKAAKILDEKGANDIEILEVSLQSVRSLAEDLEDKLTEEGIEPRRKEGERESKWIVLDYAHVIVHIFHPEERKYYNIERLWQDGTTQVQYIPLEGASEKN